ncbi:PIN domain-containing protein [Meiothermus sp.]|uniref:type II toxin-antitoxin system VapC family toxin n=1 Tax=Meiothermus sp. TaxID=1955249 RepID=UPI00307D7CAE
MALILDSGVLTALYDRRDQWHLASKDLLLRESGPLVIPAPAIPEVDYFLGKRLGLPAQLRFYQGITEGAYLVADLSEAGYQRVFELNQQYPSLRLGFVDAAVIAIAEELGIGQIATLDRRHFGAVEARIKLDLLP